MSTLMIVGICLVALGIGGRVAVGRGDSVRRKSAVSSGSPAPRPSDGRKRAANAGTGAGIIAIIASLIFGGGSGFGFGTATGVGTGTGTDTKIESTVSDVSAATYEEAAKAARDTSTITIRVNKTDIYVNEYKCEDSEEFGKMIEDIYEDGMNITVVDDYADSEPHSAVTRYLRENAYEYLVETK